MDDLNKNTSDLIQDSDFVFVQENSKISDAKMETKKIGYLKDAMMRFAENKGSIVAGAIILILVMFSLIVPFVSGYSVSDSDDYYTYCLPKVSLFQGSGFWDGTEDDTIAQKDFVYYSQFGKIAKVFDVQKTASDTGTTTYYHVRLDTYSIGCKYKSFASADYASLKAYDDTLPDGQKIIQPLVNYGDNSWVNDQGWGTNIIVRVQALFEHDANFCYEIDKDKNPIYDSNGNLQYVYKTDKNGNYIYYITSGSSSSNYSLRINYDRYYKFLNGHAASFVFGSDNHGRDIMTRLASGGRLSLALGVCVTIVNVLIGLIYGAVEGYYGGATDLVMERISEILSEVPFIIVVSLFQVYLVSEHQINPVISLFVAFVFTGWIGTASTVRMQFYRFKNQEYVLASRTLGAKDSRLIFRHILPNAIGTIITSEVLSIPAVIFSESSLSYLGIINFATTGISSIGTMLSDGQAVYTTYPNVVLWPALYISLLMICFNIFGNGLRDAFNPQLRGADN